MMDFTLFFFYFFLFLFFLRLARKCRGQLPVVSLVGVCEEVEIGTFAVPTREFVDWFVGRSFGPLFSRWNEVVNLILATFKLTCMVSLLLLAPFPNYGVFAWDESYAVRDLNNQMGQIMLATKSISAGLSAQLVDFLGTNPAKNWGDLLKIVDAPTNTADRKALFWVYIFIHFSSNPVVWERLIKKIVADAGNSLTDADFVSTRAFASLCEWKKGGAPSAGRIMPQRLAGYNPTLAALGYKYAYPAATYKDFIGLRWVPALQISNTLEADMVAAQKAALARLPGNPQFNQRIFDTTKSSNFKFPGKPDQSVAAQVSIREHPGGAKDKAAVEAWLAERFI